MAQHKIKYETDKQLTLKETYGETLNKIYTKVNALIVEKEKDQK